jgi:hypothetical protein
MPYAPHRATGDKKNYIKFVLQMINFWNTGKKYVILKINIFEAMV